MIYYCDSCSSSIYDHNNIFFSIKEKKRKIIICEKCFLKANKNFIEINNPINHYNPEVYGYIKGDSGKRKDLNDLMCRPNIESNFGKEIKKAILERKGKNK